MYFVRHGVLAERDLIEIQMLIDYHLALATHGFEVCGVWFDVGGGHLSYFASTAKDLQ
jgi:hypothetical protein